MTPALASRTVADVEPAIDPAAAAPGSSPAPGSARGVSHVSGGRLSVMRIGDELVVRDARQACRGRWRLHEHAGELAMKWQGACSAEPAAADQLAALEAVFTLDAGRRSVTLLPPFDSAQGIVLPGTDGRHTVQREMLFQVPDLWLAPGPAAIPLQYTLTGACRHPRRPPKRMGVLYQRHIPWLGQTFSFRSLDIANDLPRFNRWMNDPAVAQVWNEGGDMARHQGYLASIAADPHMQAMIACLDGEPFGYFEAYWAKENRIGPFYDADDFDRGWHVLIGEPAYRGKACATAWLTSISHYLFLSDLRTRRVVGEPRADHRQQIRNLDRSGYAKVKEFDFPHKRALLVMLLRERYFADTLWWPRDDDAPALPPAAALSSTAGVDHVRA